MQLVTLSCAQTDEISFAESWKFNEQIIEWANGTAKDSISICDKYCLDIKNLLLFLSVLFDILKLYHFSVYMTKW